MQMAHLTALMTGAVPSAFAPAVSLAEVLKAYKLRPAFALKNYYVRKVLTVALNELFLMSKPLQLIIRHLVLSLLSALQQVPYLTLGMPAHPRRIQCLFDHGHIGEYCTLLYAAMKGAALY